MHAASLSRPGEDTPHWSRVCIHALIMFGVVAMLNMAGATFEPMAVGSSHDIASTHSQASAPLADAPDAGHPVVSVTPARDGGMTMADCCGLMMLCMAMIVGFGAFVRSIRPSTGRVMWQLPRPHTVTLGHALAPHFNTTALQRTAVLRL